MCVCFVCISLATWELLAEFYVRFHLFSLFMLLSAVETKKDCRIQRVIIQTSSITVYLSATSHFFVSRTKGEIGGVKYSARRKTEPRRCLHYIELNSGIRVI